MDMESRKASALDGLFLFSLRRTIAGESELSCSRYSMEERGHNPGFLCNMYLICLCAHASEDMLFTQERGRFKYIENIETDYLFDFDIDPAIAVYSGRYEFAKRFIDEAKRFSFTGPVAGDCCEFLDYITNGGKNEYYRKILMDMITEDHILGGDCLMKFLKRYSSTGASDEGALLDEALTDLENTDKLMNSIRLQQFFHKDTDTDRDMFNKRVTEIMEHMAGLGMKLTGWRSFGTYIIPPEQGGTVILPDCFADLIDSDTFIKCCTDNPARWGINEDCCKETRYLFENGGDLTDETEYIGRRYFEKNGSRITVHINDLLEMYDMDRFDKKYFTFAIDTKCLDKLYAGNTGDTGCWRALETALKKGWLSRENIEFIADHAVQSAAGMSGDRGKAGLNFIKRLLDMIGKYSV